jgi:hypothetical protein
VRGLYMDKGCVRCPCLRPGRQREAGRRTRPDAELLSSPPPPTTTTHRKIDREIEGYIELYVYKIYIYVCIHIIFIDYIHILRRTLGELARWLGTR